MEFLSDNFISYDDEFLVKQEKATGPTIPLDSFFSVDPAFAFAEPIPQTLKNLLENDDQSFTLDPCDYEAWSTDRKKRQPFNIIKTKKEETRLCSPESFEVKIESDDKLVSRTKRILKREKAKQRIKIKQEGNVSVACEDSTTASEVINNPDLDGKTKKKMIQMIRNRISAQSSRDRKKVYMLQLEDAKSQLMDENSKLNLEKEVLLKEFKKLEETQRKLKNENEGLKRSMAQNNGLGYQFSRDGDSNTDEAEDESEGQEFSNMFKTIIGSGFGKLTGNNKKLYKSTLALATMISVVMMLNIAKQGGAIVEDGADWIKNSNLSGIQKKLLQNQELAEDLQELTEEISSSKQWDFFDRLKPLLQNLEAEHRKLSMDTQCEGTTTGTPHSPPNMVKMEELAQEDLLAEPECLLPAMDSKMGSIFGEERMNVESFRHGSDMRIVGMNTVRYFGSKNMIKFTQQNDPSQYVLKRERAKETIFL